MSLQNMMMMALGILLSWNEGWARVAVPKNTPTLEKVKVLNEVYDYAIELENGFVVVLSQHRLFTCRKNSIRDVISQYWRPARRSSYFKVFKNHIYLKEYSGSKLEIFEVDDNGMIEKLQDVDGLIHSCLEIRDEVLYTLGRIKNQCYLRLYDLEKPSAPKLKKQFPLTLNKNYFPREFVVVGEILYLLSYRSLYIFDLSGEDIQTIKRFDLKSRTAGALKVRGDRAYVSTGHELSVIDLSSLRQPKIIRKLSGKYRYYSRGNI